jgi:hypothetical protein
VSSGARFMLNSATLLPYREVLVASAGRSSTSARGTAGSLRTAWRLGDDQRDGPVALQAHSELADRAAIHFHVQAWVMTTAPLSPLTGTGLVSRVLPSASYTVWT